MRLWSRPPMGGRVARRLGRVPLLALALALAPVALACRPVPDPAGPEALVEAWVEMWNRYDLDPVRELFLDDPRLSYFSSEREGIIRGMDALLEHHRGFGFVPGGMAQPNRLWVEGLTLDLFGEAAVLTGTWYFERGGRGSEAGGSGPAPTAPDEATGTGVPPQRGPVTFVCVSTEGRWRFVHMSFSTYLPLQPT